MDRRQFLDSSAKAFGGFAATGALVPAFGPGLEAALDRVAGLAPAEAARDESFWRPVQQSYGVTRGVINLDNGNIGACPRVVTDAVIQYTRLEEQCPPEIVYALGDYVPRVRAGLAALFGCSPEEIALVRNATEALLNVLLGVPLQPGDEVLTTEHDYWSMLDALDQRRRRDGIEVKTIGVPTPPRSMDDLADAFAKAVSPRTRLILLSHPVNLTGQLFPVKAISEMAHARGIEVVVDGAHSFAHLDFKQADLGCDYFGTSLHKWLGAPIGTGMLYARKEKIGRIWPLMPPPPVRWGKPPRPTETDIRKLEFLGTQSAAPFAAIGEALAFHNGIGPGRKEERLRYLTRYWVDRLAKLPSVRLLTSFDPGMSCGLATFQLDKVDPDALQRHLRNKGVLVQSMWHHPRSTTSLGIRVTPNLYTTLDELGAFCETVEQVAREGLPKA